MFVTKYMRRCAYVYVYKTKRLFFYFVYVCVRAFKVTWI